MIPKERPLTPRHREMLGVCSLLFCFALASCAESPAQRLSRSDRSAQLMPDGKRWTLANLNVEIPGSYCYDDDSSKCERYGRLYTWAAAREACGLLGAPWRLPSMEEWRNLARFYGGLYGDGSGDGKGVYREFLVGGRSGLEMRLGGGRQEGGYARMEAHGFYWSTSEESPTSVRLLNFGKGRGAVFDQDGGGKTNAYSVRCVSDKRRRPAA